MKILAKLKGQLEDNQAKLTKLLDLEGERNLTDEEKAEFTQAEQTKTDLEAKIERREAHLESQRKLKPADDDAVDDNGTAGQVTAAGQGVDIGNAKSIKVKDKRQDDPTLGFRNMGEFAMAVFNAFNPAGPVRDNRLDLAVQIANATGMSQGSGPDGGFLVPPSFSQTIWDALQAQSDNLLQYCDVYTITGESLTIPAIAETSRVAGSRWGGVRGYWISEAEQMTGSKPKLRQVKLEPHQLAVLTYVTDKLLNNAAALQQFIVRAAVDEINFQVGDAIINGDGIGKPKGIMGTGPMIEVAKETSQAADTILTANISKMWSRMHPRSRGSAIWLYNVDCEPQMDTLFTAVKNVAGSENVGGFANPVFADGKMKGRPAIPSEYCPTVGDAGDIICADFKGYAVGIRGGVQSAMSMHLKFDYNETAFRFIYEVDGQPWLQSAITPYKGSNTLSTFVRTAVR
jgi:HK97 family phage major capsid protein